jgi:hypothetical protein
MNTFISFTLAAGVAITSTSVATAAGTPKLSAAQKSSVTRQAPVVAGTVAFDRMAMNRELTRISEFLTAINGADAGLLDDDAGVAVGKKVSPSFTF